MRRRDGEGGGGTGAAAAGRTLSAAAAGAALLGAVLLAVSGATVPADADRGPGAPSLAAGHPYLDGPPPGHTGGFGEPACQRCHFDAPVNPPEASLEVRGLPGAFVPDSSYRLTVRVTAPELGRAGFEAALRCSGEEREGRQAGGLSPIGERAEVVRGGGTDLRGDSTVLYARHTREGSRPTAPDTATWRLAWTPPAGCASAVLHAAANAANGDASEFGDRVLTGSWEVGRSDDAR